MPSPTTPHTPGYRFKDGKLMIFHEDEVMLIQGGKPRHKSADRQAGAARAGSSRCLLFIKSHTVSRILPRVVKAKTNKLYELIACGKILLMSALR
jgi:hypothetical protein